MDTEEGERRHCPVFEDGENRHKPRTAGSPETLRKARGGFSPRGSRKEHSPDNTLMLPGSPFWTSPEPRDKRCCFKPLRQWLCCYSSNRKLPESLHPEVICFPPSRGTSASREGWDLTLVILSSSCRVAVSVWAQRPLLELSIGKRPLVATGQEGEVRKGRASIPEQQEGPALLGARQGSLLSF